MSQASEVQRPAPRRRVEKSTDESLKETFESVIIAFILAFIFRAYVVEAFVIPTGSMGPTLLGEHMHTVCSQCGFTFDSDARNRPRTGQGMPVSTHLVCPMCHFPNPKPASLRSSSGDRILVHKYVYSLVEPSRWDVVVFKDPGDPSENFIKRLIGLPQEKIWIIEGDVYVQPVDESAPWQIARKTDARHGYKTQSDLWQPIYHSQYIPLDQGQPSLARQVPDPDNLDHTLTLTWATPWSAPDQDENQWQIADQRSYRHTTSGRSQITFDFDKAIDPLQATWYPHNQFYQGRQVAQPKPAIRTEDLRLAATFVPDSSGLSISLATQIRTASATLNAPLASLHGRIASDGQAWLELVQADGSIQSLTPPQQVKPFKAGAGTRVELWYVDQEASLWVNGSPVIVHRFDHPMEWIIHRSPLASQPQPRIEVNGPAVTLHEVEVDRDIYYTASLAGSTLPGLGTLVKVDGKIMGQPARLAPDQFYCLGDNSPMSSDSRFWPSVNPWIQERMIDPNVQQTGIVPRKLMLGRAFFVYFPGMYPWKQGGAAVIPNFGDLRFIH